jgi:hypothetical protein
MNTFFIDNIQEISMVQIVDFPTRLDNILDLTSQIPLGRLIVYIKFLFSPSTIRLWNNLPTDLRNSPCQQMFKNEIRKAYDLPVALQMRNLHTKYDSIGFNI